MRRKGLVYVGVVAMLFVLLNLQGCKSSAEKSLLSAYFHAVSLKDTSTMASMAVEPVSIDHDSWEIVSVSEEKIEPTNLVELGKAEMEYKKKLEEHVGPVMDAEDALYGAQEELKAARTGASRAAAKRKVDEMQAKFDEERELHKELQRNYNEAKDAAQREREIAVFSVIGASGDLPNIMDLTGTVHSKEVDVKIVDKAGEENLYRFHLKKYELRDEAANINHRGRWVIVGFEPVG